MTAPAPVASPADARGQNASPAFRPSTDPPKITLGDIGDIGEIGEIDELGTCSATASCAGGGSVHCSASSGSCWLVDNCYAVCNNQYYWCAYRPYPCPV